MWRLLRLKLVFWLIETCFYIMANIVIVIACDCIEILFQTFLVFFLLISLIKLYGINFSDRDRALLRSLFMVLVSGLVSALLILVFFALFVSLISKLGRLKDGQLKIVGPKFRVFSPWISHESFLSRAFNILRRLLAIGDMLIRLSEYGEGQKTGLDLDFNGFLYQVFLIV